jgi:hypothetical protein
LDLRWPSARQIRVHRQLAPWARNQTAMAHCHLATGPPRFSEFLVASVDAVTETEKARA